MKVILASKSPRRQKLLKEMGVSFSVVSIEVSEIPDKNMNAREQILDIARRKAEAAYTEVLDSESEPFVIIASDTEVIFNDELQGKPLSSEHAVKTLMQLSGNWHEVTTAIVLISGPEKRELSHLETTQIKFRQLSQAEVESYVASGDPMDKAGSYGIQGEAKKFVEKIEGDFENVVGLSTSALKKLLRLCDQSLVE